MVIRPEESRDWRAIHALETAAFPSPAEAELVVALRRAGTVPLLSLVADDAGAIVAHAMFSPPEYYPRFGFVPASRFGIGSEYEAPDEAFMALELAPNALAGRTGLVRYHPTFAVVAQVAVVLLAAVIVLGVTSGALVTEGAVLVPFWRSLAPSDFLAWYRRHAALLFRFFGSLEIVATLATLGALAMRWHATGAADVWLGGAAVLCIAVLLLFPAYFQHVNGRFERGTMAAADVGPELVRWARWHWLRTAMALGAFVAALMAHGAWSSGA